MVTIDPRRDTAPILTKYVEHFLKRTDVRRTDVDQQLRAAANAFGAQYSVQVAADGSEEVGHSAFLYAVDENGRIVVTWPFGVDPKSLAADLRILVDRARR
jgi:protein SCO1/2